MSAPPYQKLFWGSYHKHTAHLRHAREHGAYLLLIGALWNNEGKLPGDDETLAAHAMLSVKDWLAIKPKLMAPNMLRIVRGKLTQARVADDLAKYRDTSGKRKQAGKSGGTASAEKKRGNGPAIATDLPTKPEPEPKPEREEGGGGSASAPALAVVTVTDWPEGDAQAHAALLVALANSSLLDPNRSHGLVRSTGRLAAWRRDGASWAQDVRPVVASIIASQREPVSTWAFFDKAIARSIASNRQALSIPETHGSSHDRRPRQSAFADNLANAFTGSEIAIDARR